MIIGKSWSENEINFLKENYADKGVKFCANKLERTRSAIFNRAYKLGLILDKKKLRNSITELRIHTTVAEKEKIRQLARIKGYNLSDWIRKICIEADKDNIPKLKITPSEGDKKAVIYVRLNSEESDKVEKLANSSKLYSSNWIREYCLYVSNVSNGVKSKMQKKESC